MIVAVTGHRPDKLGGWYTPNAVHTAVVEGLRMQFEELKPSYIITGMALGVDQWAAEVALAMGIPFVAAIPFNGQENKWPPHSQARYQNLLSKANSAFVISPGAYEPAKMHIRNKWMVNEASVLVAVWNGSNGGTAGCVGYAQSIGRLIKWVNLKPEIWALAAKSAPKKEVGIVAALMNENGEVPGTNKTPLSPFIGQIKEKAEEQAQKQLLAAKEQAAKQQEWIHQKKLESIAKATITKGGTEALVSKFKQKQNIFQKLLAKEQAEEEESKAATDFTYKRVMDLDD